MCGITGIFQFANTPVEKSNLKKSTDSILHRGPDAEGQWVNKKQNIGLGHRRLSIIDLSDKGRQPMHFADDRYSITYNGEIYNYLELKKGLKSKGYTFISETDTEVLLAMYQEYNIEMMFQLDGMFSFAIWDEKEQELFCARDRFGEKPFYYFKDKEKFVFASEIKAIWASGIRKIINEDKRKEYIDRAIIRTEQTVTETFFDGINILDAASYMKISANGEYSITKYWSLENVEQNKNISFSKAKTSFLDLFQDSIEKRLRSDVEVGSSLSGGLDSSSIVSIIDNLKVEGQIQNTFSARFKNFEKDEGKYIKYISDKFSSIKVHSCYPEEENLLDLLEKASFFHEEPIGSASVLAQWSVYELAREKGVTVMLDGQGADEYLAGYVPIYNIYLSHLYYYRRHRFLKEEKMFKEKHNQNFHKEFQAFDSSIKSRIKYRVDEFRNRPSEIPKKKVRSLKEHLEILTVKKTLKELLRYADRNSMAHSREVRLPFLSHKLVEFVYSLPDDFLLRNGWTKFILRKSMEKSIPKEICWRIDKVGYEPPQNRWLKKDNIQDILSIQKKKYEIQKSKNVSYTNSTDWRLLADYFL